MSAHAHIQNWEQYHYYDYQNGYDSSEDNGSYEHEDERHEIYRDLENQRDEDAAHAEHIFKICTCAAVWLTTIALYFLTWYLKLPEFMCLMMWLVLFPMFLLSMCVLIIAGREGDVRCLREGE